MPIQNTSALRRRISEIRADLLNQDPGNRCEHLRTDKAEPYCANKSDPEEARNICCIASLQLYCLDPERHTICMYHPDHRPSK